MQSVADAMVELIEEAAIPVCMVGLLYALPNTQLTRRLEKEGRLHPPPRREDVKSADQCTMGLNFETVRPRQEILADYVRILERVYDPFAYAGRLLRLAKMLDNSSRKQQRRAQHSRRNLGSLEILHRIISNLPEPRDLFRRTLMQCVASNSDSTRRIVLLMALYMDVGPFAREVIGRIENMIAAFEPAAIRTTRAGRAGKPEFRDVKHSDPRLASVTMAGKDNQKPFVREQEQGAGNQRNKWLQNQS
jgi:Domain of unknown function (DUF4070)